MAWLNGKEGVWRTVGGRKIFIATGQSLKDAMKASGKFKNLNDNKDKEEKNIQKDKDYTDIPGFKDYEYNTKTGEVKVKDDVLKEANRQNRLRTAKANAEASAKEYEKYYSDYKKYADKANEAGYGTTEYEKYSAKRKEAYQKAMDAKEVALTEFNKTIPYDEMFDVAKEIKNNMSKSMDERIAFSFGTVSH